MGHSFSKASLWKKTSAARLCGKSMGYEADGTKQCQRTYHPSPSAASLYSITHLFYNSSTLAFIVDHFLVLDVGLRDYQDTPVFQCESELAYERDREMERQEISKAAPGKGRVSVWPTKRLT